MNHRHLTAEQMTSWMVGDRTPTMSAHVAVCPECRDQLQQTEDTLAGFGQSVRSWSAARMPIQPPRLATKPNGSYLWMRTPSLVYGLATLALAVATFLWQDHGARSTAQEAMATDAALLRQLDRQVSETVPTPMQPLTQLVDWQDRSDNSARSSYAEERLAE